MPTASRYSDAWLDDLRRAGDPPVDAVIGELLQHRSKLEDVNAALRGWVHNAQPPPQELPQALRSLLREHARLPADLDRARIDRASAFFVDHGMTYSLLLGTTSLLECYSASNGVKTLYATDRMGYSGAERRLGETGQFVMHVMSPGGLFEQGGAIPVVVKVRLMHSASRLLLREHAWDEATLGVPICQEDLLGTLMTFAHTPLEYMPKLGVHPTPEQREDLVYLWGRVGVLMGMPEEAMPRNAAEAGELAAAVTRRQRAVSPEGLELTAAMVKAYCDIIPGTLFDGLFVAMLRAIAGDDLCDMMKVPRSKWEVAIGGQMAMARAANAVQGRSAVVNRVVNRLGLAMLDFQTRVLTKGRRAGFEMPTDIRRAWRLPAPGAAERAATFVADRVAQATRKLPARKHAQAAEALLEVAVLVAAADGEIDDLEQESLVSAARALFAADTDEQEIRARVAAAVVSCEGQERDVAVALLAKRLERLGIVAEGLAVGAAVAFTSDAVATEERAVLEKLAHAASFGADPLVGVVDETHRAIAT